MNTTRIIVTHANQIVRNFPRDTNDVITDLVTGVAAVDEALTERMAYALIFSLPVEQAAAALAAVRAKGYIAGLYGRSWPQGKNETEAEALARIARENE